MNLLTFFTLNFENFGFYKSSVNYIYILINFKSTIFERLFEFKEHPKAKKAYNFFLLQLVFETFFKVEN